jgi:hypothetical protein
MQRLMPGAGLMCRSMSGPALVVVSWGPRIEAYRCPFEN